MNNQKQITTVYVPTDEAPYFIVKDVEKEFIKARVTEKEAYLYTPEEHAAVQGYREALEKIESLCGTHDEIWHIVHKALSKAEDKGEGFETSYGEVLSTIRTPIEQPTNSLDELERWVKEYPHFIFKNRLLDKIQELKTITT